MKFNLRTIFLYGAVFGAEGCWLYASLLLLNDFVTPKAISISGLLLLFPISFGCNVLILLLQRRAVREAVSWILWLVAMFAMVKIQLYGSAALTDYRWMTAIPHAFTQMPDTFGPALFVLFGSAILWWLGRRLACLKMNFKTTIGEFQFGLVLLALCFLLATQMVILLPGALLILLIFFIFSLTGIALTHEWENNIRTSFFFTGQRAVLLIISVALIIAVSFLVSMAVTPELLTWLTTGIKRAGELIMKLLSWIAGLLPGDPALSPDITSEIKTPAVQNDEVSLALPDSALRVSRLLWGLAFGLLVLFALWRVSFDLSRWLKSRPLLSSDGEPGKAPGSSLRKIISYLRGIVEGWIKRLGLSRFSKKERSLPPEIKSIRQIYRQVLRWAAANGQPRPASSTPYEYLAVLRDLAPGAHEGLAFITNKYVNSRYGYTVPTKMELDQIKKTWHTIKQDSARK